LPSVGSSRATGSPPSSLTLTLTLHGRLFEGDRVVSVNGWHAVGHAETTRRLKQKAGTLRLKVIRAPPE
jgi:hypothetical protein